MWKWVNCYLSGRHDYGVWCEPGAVYLRCVHCGKRSNGWLLNAREARVDAGQQPLIGSRRPTRPVDTARAAR